MSWHMDHRFPPSLAPPVAVACHDLVTCGEHVVVAIDLRRHVRIKQSWVEQKGWWTDHSLPPLVSLSNLLDHVSCLVDCTAGIQTVSSLPGGTRNLELLGTQINGSDGTQVYMLPVGARSGASSKIGSSASMCCNIRKSSNRETQVVPRTVYKGVTCTSSAFMILTASISG